MFVFLSKRISIPNKIELTCISWNTLHGFIACGGCSGLLKVLKLELPPTNDPKQRGVAAPNLTMNQTLESHKQNGIMVVCWNERHKKLTSSDEKGLIIVWKLLNGSWFEEMVNNREESVVTDLKWNYEGNQICIIYEDGMVIIGSVEGHRIWGKDIKKQLNHLEWSPDGKCILFGTTNGQVLVYESRPPGNELFSMQLFSGETDDGDVPVIVSIHWYDGNEGYADLQAPTLAICFSNGRCQLMRNETDNNPVLIETGIYATKARWSSNGSILAIAGVQEIEEGKYTNVVQFYNPYGHHLRSLKVPGTSIKGLTWEGSGLKLALAVDSFIFFANVKPEYKWGYFSNTLVYSFTKVDRPEHCVVFWNVKTQEKYVKYVKRLVFVRCVGEYCALVARVDDMQQSDKKFVIIICNSIGSAVFSKFISIEPLFVSMTEYQIICATESTIHVWQYRSQQVSNLGIESQLATALRKDEEVEYIFHIDDIAIKQYGGQKVHVLSTNDSICCLGSTSKDLLIGRESGTVHYYSLSNGITAVGKFVLSCRAQTLAMNCDGSMLAVIDFNGIFSLHRIFLHTPTSTSNNLKSEEQPPTSARRKEIQSIRAEKLGVEKKEVWSVIWSEDNPELFALMEKTKMYVYRGQNAEENIPSAAYLARFNNLKIKGVLLDEIMEDPDNPDKELLLDFEIKSLRDTEIMLKTVNIEDAYQYIRDNPHPRLWRLLAEHSLENLDFPISLKAFVQCKDYQGLQFVKRLQLLDDKSKQLAEVAAYFKRFDEAEKIYISIDRKDLAIDLRVRIGDWFGVLHLLGEKGAMSNSDDDLLVRAWNHIGDYYTEIQKYNKALSYYTKSQNYDKLVECYYVLEDYKALEKLIVKLPEGSQLLLKIAEKFSSVGICEHAMRSYLRAGEVKMAIDCCVELNQWDQAVSLAQQHNFKEIEELLFKYANHLVENNRIPEAIELYQKANRHTEAAKLLSQLAQKEGKKMHPQRAKIFYVIAALEIEKFRKKLLDNQLSGGSNATANSIRGLIEHDSSTAFDKTLDNAWRGAEAYHFFMMAQRQFYSEKLQDALVTTLRLFEYEDILGVKDVNSMVALVSYYCGEYTFCSKAFIRLESQELGNKEKSEIAKVEQQDLAKEKYKDLAVEIFTKHPPVGTSSTLRPVASCPSCSNIAFEYEASCSQCSLPFYPCIVTGKTIFGSQFWTCAMCKHRAFDDEIYSFKYCPLCHSPTQI